MFTQKNAVKEVKDTIHHLQEQCCDKAQDAKEELREVAHKAGNKVREIYDAASHEARDVTAIAEKQIRRNPIAAAATALGLGVLLGALLRRR